MINEKNANNADIKSLNLFNLLENSDENNIKIVDNKQINNKNKQLNVIKEINEINNIDNKFSLQEKIIPDIKYINLFKLNIAKESVYFAIMLAIVNSILLYKLFKICK